MLLNGAASCVVNYSTKYEVAPTRLPTAITSFWPVGHAACMCFNTSKFQLNKNTWGGAQSQLSLENKNGFGSVGESKLQDPYQNSQE